MSETKVYPRIWDSDGERKIIGETRVSWLVQSRSLWSPPIKVSKKTPNEIGRNPTWFFSKSDLSDRVFVLTHFRRIVQEMEYTFPNQITADQLRQIAAIIGYEVKV